MSGTEEGIYTNSDIFSERYLSKELLRRPEWDCDEDAESALEELQTLYEEEYETVQNYEDDEEDTIDDWIQPVLKILGFEDLGETGFPNEAGSIDLVLFDSDGARRESAEARRNDDYASVYQNSATILEAKAWDTDFGKKFSEDRKYFDASQQISFYLSQMPLDTVEWGILTNGREWRLYGTNDHQSYVYFQIDDLPELINRGDLHAFKYFYVLFRSQAFTRRDGECFLDVVYRGSEETSLDIGDDLQDNVFNGLAILAEGFIETNDLVLEDDGTLSADSLQMDVPADEPFTLDDLREQSLIYLYRLMFLFYAESRGLLKPISDSNTRTYHAELSLLRLRDEIVEYGDSPEDVAQTYLKDTVTQWTRLNTFFSYIDGGKENIGIQAYDGGLFDRAEHQFLNEHSVSNHHLSQVIYLLSTTETSDGYEPVDYRELQIRHLGSIYEGLLQHQFQVATESMVAVREDDEEEWIEEDEYDDDDDNGIIVDRVDEGNLYLATDDHERKISGSFYTPKYIVDYIIGWTIKPKIKNIEKTLEEEDYSPGTADYARQFRSHVLDLNILDPAMGSGHFLTRTTSYLAREVIKQVREADELVAIAIERDSVGGDDSEEAFADGGSEEDSSQDSAPVSKFRETQVRRDIAKECIFGVDRNLVAVELAKLSMWLETLAADQPLAFLDHHLKQGDSLLGTDIEEIDGIDEIELDDEQSTLPTTVPDRREEVIETLVSIFEELVDIPNETIEDAREMKRIYYEDIQNNEQYRRFKQLANVDQANELGLDWNRGSAFERSGIQSDAFIYMAEYLESDEHWYGEGVEEGVVTKGWFQAAQEWAEDLSFFHWKLEFPEVYYNISAEEREDAGFDAIIGNPPWLGTRTGSIDSTVSEYYQSRYNVDGQTDLAEVFLKRCIELGEDVGSIGMVVPKRLATNEGFEDLRESIAVEETLNYAIDFDVAFEGVNNDALVLVIDSEPDEEEITVGERIGETEIETRSIDSDLLDAMPFTIIPVNSSNQQIELVKTINQNSTWELDPFVDIDRGAEVGMNHSSISQTSGPNSLPLVNHTDVKRHAIDYTGYYINTAEIDESDLKDEEIYTDTPKILIRFLESDIVAARDDTGYVSTNLVYHLQCTTYLDYFLGLLSSKLTTFWYRHAFQTEEVKFPHVQKSHINKLPIVVAQADGRLEQVEDRLAATDPSSDVVDAEALSIVDSGTNDFNGIRGEIQQRVNEIIDIKGDLYEVDLDLTRYIGLSERETELSDIGVFQSLAEEDSLLKSTADEFRDDKLKIGRVQVSRDDDTITVSASVRYKPDNPEKHETENGYKETELLDAFQIIGISTEQAKVIKEFVDYIVENHNDVRGFYKDTTSTISPLQRLREIEVPQHDDFRDEWNLYEDAKSHAEDLNQQISELESSVDTFFYLLFGIDNSEISLIEEDLGKDF